MTEPQEQTWEDWTPDNVIPDLESGGYLDLITGKDCVPVPIEQVADEALTDWEEASGGPEPGDEDYIPLPTREIVIAGLNLALARYRAGEPIFGPDYKEPEFIVTWRAPGFTRI
jgi:hypothetical protein